MPNTIATSEITLYYNTGLMPSNNYVIEDIDEWLKTNADSKDVIEDFQFLELKPKMSIKIQKSQEYLQFDFNYDIDYCHITRAGYGFDDLGAFYFVVNKHWKSKDCLELELEMDVLNTFTWNTDYVPTDKTLVLREHKDRWKSLKFETRYTDYQASYWAAGANRDIYIFDNRLKTGYYSVSSVSNLPNNISWVKPADINMTLGRATITLKNNGSAVSLKLSNILVKFDTDACAAIVDMQSEGINPVLFKQKEEDILDSNGDVTWLLHYINQDAIDPDSYNQVNPVECRLLPRDAAAFAIPTATGSITTSTISSGHYFYYFYTVLGGLSFNVNNGSVFNLRSTSYGRIQYFVEIYNNSGTLRFRYGCSTDYRDIGEGVVLTWKNTINNPSSIVITNPLESVNVYDSTSALSDAALVASLIKTGSYNHNYTDGSATSTTLIGSAEIDRTDSKNIKIIELPYCPTPIDSNEDGIIMSGDWEYISASQSFELTDLDNKFYNSFRSTVNNPINVLMIEDLLRDVGDDSRPWMDYETKLYHSDYYKPKFVYDSFFLDFQLENLDLDRYLQYQYDEKLKVDFVTSRNIVSKFCFLLPQYLLKYSTQDYDNVVNVARNNEQVLYTSQYINYLRNGYNYDLKSKERQDVAGGIGIGLSAAALIGSIALTASGYGTAAGIAGIVGSVAGLVGSTVNYAKTVAQNEQNIAQKLSEAKNQAVSVQNADDVDLLNAYSNNRAKLCTYKVTEKMKKALYDLFWFCGYATQEQKVPQIDTRYWFNFLQCELVIREDTNLSKEMINLLKEKFKEGVTFYHRQNTGTVLVPVWTWDLNRSYENWETTLMDEVESEAYQINNLINIRFETTFSPYYDTTVMTAKWTGQSINGSTQYIRYEVFRSLAEWENQTPYEDNHLVPDADGNVTKTVQHQGIYCVRLTIVDTQDLERTSSSKVFYDGLNPDDE